MKEKFVHPRKVIGNQDKIEWKNYQEEVELAMKTIR